MITYEPSQRLSIEEFQKKILLKKRMVLYLKENEFNKDEEIKEMKTYFEKFGNIEKGEKSSLFKNNTNDNEETLNIPYAASH